MNRILRGTIATLLAAAAIGAGVTPAKAAFLTNGALTVNIRDDNGAIGSANRGGEFYASGTFVSDFGFQVGTNTGTFVVNNAFGSEMIASTVVGTPSQITVTGTYQGVNFTRVYEIVGGTDVLRTTTTLTNTTAAAVNLRYFDTADPDQGGFETFNDVFSLVTGAGTANVAEARGSDNRTVVAGTLDSQARVGFMVDGSLGIGSGSQLNNFFSNPINDPNGGFSDIGFAVALETLLGAGGTRTYVYDQSFGLTSDEARGDFAAANTTVVPAPPGAVLAVIGAFGLIGGRSFRRRTVAAAA